MSKFIPTRPQYARERADYTYPLFAAFAILFAAHCADKFTKLDLGSIVATAFLALAAFVAPVLIFARTRGRGYLRTLRFHRPYATHIPLLLCALLVLLAGSTLLSIVFNGMDTVSNSAATVNAVSTGGIGKALLMIPTLVLLPAFAEELMFRGLLCAELDRRGTLRAILVSALLFALIHFDASNLLLYFLSGVLLALVLYATESLICVMLLHAAYNAASLFARPYINALYRFTGSTELFLFLLVLLLVCALALFCMFAARLYRARSRAGLREPRRNVPFGVQFYTLLDALCEWPVIASAVLAIVGLIVL